MRIYVVKVLQRAANRAVHLKGGCLAVTRRMRSRLLLLALVASLPFVLWSVLPVGSEAQSPGQIQKKIDRNQSLIGGHKARERVLTSDISGQTRRINTLEGDITRLSNRQQKLQTSLDAKRARARDRAAQAARGARPARRACARGCWSSAASSRSGWWSSTRPTRRTRSRSCSSPRASPTC